MPTGCDGNAWSAHAQFIWLACTETTHVHMIGIGRLHCPKAGYKNVVIGCPTLEKATLAKILHIASGVFEG